MKRSLLCAAVVGAAVAVAPGEIQAQGSAVQTHSSCSTAMASAGVASPCDDGSAVLFNPAALALQPSVLGLGWTGITISNTFTYDPALGGETIERDATTASVPFGFLSYRFSDRLAAAIGVFNPYGLGLDWPETFEGRFVSYDTDLRNVYVQPTLSFAASERFSVGVGLDYVMSSIAINQRIDLATTGLPLPGAPAGTTGASLGIPLGTDFADLALEGDGSAVTFHVGALARISDMISVGARYMHGAEIDFEGDADFTAIPTGITLAPGNPISPTAQVSVDQVLAAVASGLIADQEIETSVPVPAQWVVGVALTPIPTLRLLFDYQRTAWSEWDEAPIDFQGNAPDQTLVLDYQDTDTYRLGGELTTGEALIVRAGFVYNTAAQREFSVSPLLPEAERNYYSAGLGYRFNDALQVDLGYQLIDQSDRRGRVRPRTPGLSDDAARALNVGVYTADAHVLNATLSYRFGSRR